MVKAFMKIISLWKVKNVSNDVKIMNFMKMFIIRDFNWNVKTWFFFKKIL